MKKIALISPKGNAFGKNDKLNEFLNETGGMQSFRALWTGPNLGLITIAGLFPKDWEVDYIDENYKEIDYEKKYDMVCISSMTQQIVNAYQIIDKFKKLNILTVIGGIHSTILPDEAMQHADVVMVGEGEVIWPQFILDYENGSVKKIYRDDSEKRFQFENHIIPRYDLLKDYNYQIITIQTTRGCPHNCSFCCASKVFGSGYRRKNNSNILEELKTIKKMYPDALVLFADDNFFVNRKNSKKLMQEMIRMNIRWLAQTDVSISQDEELLELMVLSGCQWVVIGFESVHHDSLYQLDDRNWKLKHLPGYTQAIEKIQSFGIGVYGTFIIGLDEDNIDVFDETENFIKQSKLYGVNITVPTPLPGTRLRDKMYEENRILVNDWSYYTFWDVNIKPSKMKISELEDGLLRLYKNIFDEAQVHQRLLHMKYLAKRRKLILNKIK